MFFLWIQGQQRNIRPDIGTALLEGISTFLFEWKSKSVSVNVQFQNNNDYNNDNFPVMSKWPFSNAVVVLLQLLAELRELRPGIWSLVGNSLKDSEQDSNVSSVSFPFAGMIRCTVEG